MIIYGHILVGFGLIWLSGWDARSLGSAAFAISLYLILFYPYRRKRNKHL